MSNIQKYSTPIDPATVQMFSSIAQSLARSGLFPLGGKHQPKTIEEQAAQAFVKIMAGHGLGIDPITAMQHIHVIDGKTSLDATLVAGKIKGSGKYDYRIERLDDKACVIQFFENTNEGRQQIGVASWTEQDAKAAELLGRANWGKYRRDMLFSRCITFGARRYCPDVFIGPIYAPDELGSDEAPTPAEAPQQARAIEAPGGDGHSEPAQLPQTTEYTWAEKVRMVCDKMDAAAERGPEELERVLEAMDRKTADWPEEHRTTTQQHAQGIWERYGSSEPEPAGLDVGDGEKM